MYQAPRLHVRELGEGAPVVLLHPGPGLDGSVFLPGVERLAETGQECLDVWRRQLPLFADTDISAMLSDVHFQPEAHRSRDWGELHALPALAAYERPLLAIGGTHDRMSPPPFARRIADAAPNSELLLVDGGHFPFAEDPAGYWDAVADWLSRTR